MKKSFIKTSLLTLSLFVLPMVAAAQNVPSAGTITSMHTGSTLQTIENTFLDYVTRSISVLISLGILFFFIGLIRYIYSAGNVKGRAAGRQTIIWSLTGIFIIVTLWGVIRVMQVFLFS